MQQITQPAIMAIINVSLDSFNGDGVATELALRQRLDRAIAAGADIIDVGGQSTRPGAAIISVSEEIQRVVPAIKLARQLTAKPISIDTFKPDVARAAIAAGATMVNDVHGCANAAMAELVRDANSEVIIMHSRGTPDTMSTMTDYTEGVVTAVQAFFIERTTQLTDEYGINPKRIIIDPGIGFAKTAAQSFELTQQLTSFTELGFRVLYGASQKSFLGRALSANGIDQVPVTERFTATNVTTVFALLQGVSIVRVHDVKAAVDARRILQCIMNPTLLAKEQSS